LQDAKQDLEGIVRYTNSELLSSTSGQLLRYRQADPQKRGHGGMLESLKDSTFPLNLSRTHPEPHDMTCQK